VSSGEEMATKARELARHFDVQGTPVMIGMWCSWFQSILLSYMHCWQSQQLNFQPWQNCQWMPYLS